VGGVDRHDAMGFLGLPSDPMCSLRLAPSLIYPSEFTCRCSFFIDNVPMRSVTFWMGSFIKLPIDELLDGRVLPSERQ
jgi:hypothetical protein